MTLNLFLSNEDGVISSYKDEKDEESMRWEIQYFRGNFFCDIKYSMIIVYY